MASELLPCPLCENEAEFVPYKRDGLTLQCKTLGCVKINQRALRHSIEWLREQMTERWNRRATPQAPAAAPAVDGARSKQINNLAIPAIGLAKMKLMAGDHKGAMDTLNKFSDDVDNITAPAASGGEAVACDVIYPDGTPVAVRVPISYADELLSKHEWGNCVKANFLYTAPQQAAQVPEAAAVGSGEAVAYRVRHKNFPHKWLLKKEPVIDANVECQPLYTRPSADAAAVPAYKPGDRVTWTSRSGRKFPGTVRALTEPSGWLYHIGLDDRTEADAYAHELAAAPVNGTRQGEGG